jgi:hypothetical protein
MSATEDYYVLLRVSPEADTAVIRAAYRALMRRYHPDANASVDAVAKAKAINGAYACLRDESNRTAYDRQRMPRSGGQRSTSPASPARRPRPVWSGPTPRAEPPTPWFRPTWGKAVGLGIAALITSITFTITSTIPPAESAVAEPALEVTMRMQPRGPTIADSGKPDCRGKKSSASRTGCGS